MTDLREAVKEAYKEAIERKAGSGCCETGASCEGISASALVTALK